MEQCLVKAQIYRKIFKKYCGDWRELRNLRNDVGNKTPKDDDTQWREQYRSREGGVSRQADLCIGDREARADRQRRELIDRIATGEPVRKLFVVEALGHVRMPFAGYRPDHRVGIELATIDAHRAAKAATDLEGRLDDGVAGEAWWHRLEIGDFPGRAAAGHTVPPRWIYVRRYGPASMPMPLGPRLSRIV